MDEIKQIRFIAANFSALQGLRAVPLGLCLVGVCLWANGLQQPATDFLVPVASVVVSAALLFAIDRYYLRVFGQVQRTAEGRRLEWLISIIGAVLALGAFWLDMTLKLPVSLLGLVFALGLLADYLRITWAVKGRFLRYYPLVSVLMIGVSILPLLGITNWWQIYGLAHPMIAIAMAIGVFTIISGIWGHIFLVRTLPLRMEAGNDHAI